MICYWPLIFLLFINDITTCSLNNTFILFADDTNIIISDFSANKRKLHLTINVIILWVSGNKLTINIDKNHCMFFRNNIYLK